MLITGCSTGIGRATAEVLVGRGHEVMATARRPDTLAGLPVARALALDVVDDASVTALLAETGSVDVLVDNAGVLCLLAGLLVGCVNAALIVWLNVPPLLAGLGTMFTVQGLKTLVGGRADPDHRTDAAQRRAGDRPLHRQLHRHRRHSAVGIPLSVYLFAVIAVLVWVFLERTRYGRVFYAVGGNAEAARLAGARVRRFQFGAYAMSGMLAAVAGIILASRLRQGDVTAGDSALLDAVAMTLVGYAVLGAKKPNALGTVVGAIFIGLILQGLTQLGLPYYTQDLIRGLVLIRAADVVLAAPPAPERGVNAGPAGSLSTGSLSSAGVPAYLADRPVLRELVDPATVTVSEVGDGNLNLVFVCADGTGRRLVLKQALPYVRLVGPEWPMTEERATREAAALRAHGALSDNVCRLVDFDADRYVLALQDLSDHQVFRTRLNAGGAHAGVAELLADYVADVAFGTSFLALGEEEFRRRAAAAVNPELCAITEDLILTEPYRGAQRNSVRPGAAAAVRRLQADQQWVDAALALKHRFLTTQEALLHGDLHTGSVFVRGTAGADDFSVKAFDAEFACYGPVGFDLGLLWANMLFAGVRAAVLGEPDRARSLAETVPLTWERFCGRLAGHWPRRHSPVKYPDSYLTWWLGQIQRDAFGFAGCEIARRTIGLAKVSDLESLDDAGYAAVAETMLRLSRLLLVEQGSLTVEQLIRVAVPADRPPRR